MNSAMSIPIENQFNQRQPYNSNQPLSGTTPAPTSEKRGLGYLALLLFLFFMCAAIQKAIPALEVARPTYIIAIVAIVAGIASKISRREPFVHCAPTYLIVIFITLTGLSVPGAAWPSYAFATFTDALKVVVIFLLISNVVTSARKLNGVVWAMCLGGLAPAIGSIRHFFSGVDLIDGYRSNWVGIYSNPNDLAYAMAMLIPLALALTITSRRWVAKLVALGSIGFYTLSIFFTFSRMGFLCISIIVIMTVLRSQQRVRNFVLMGLLLAVCIPFVPARYWERTSTITKFKEDRSSMGRLEAWSAGMEMLSNHPLLGVGAGCYQLGWTEKDSHGETRSAHNTFFQALGELGLLGFVTFITFLFVSFRLLWRLKKQMLQRRRDLGQEEFQLRYGTLMPVVIALDIGFWVFIVSSLTGGLLFTWYPYIFSGMAIAAREIFQRQEDAALGIVIDNKTQYKTPYPYLAQRKTF